MPTLREGMPPIILLFLGFRVEGVAEAVADEI